MKKSTLIKFRGFLLEYLRYLLFFLYSYVSNNLPPIDKYILIPMDIGFKMYVHFNNKSMFIIRTVLDSQNKFLYQHIFLHPKQYIGPY